jgi:hypothetical protein
LAHRARANLLLNYMSQHLPETLETEEDLTPVGSITQPQTASQAQPLR